MNNTPTLIIITGNPASGKSSLAKKISEQLKIPVLSKDSIKEDLFEILGCDSREQSIKLGKASIVILWNIVSKLLNNNLIIESNFDPQNAAIDIKKLKAKLSFNIVQILCTASKDILISRFIERVKAGNRHSGHQDSIDPNVVRSSFYEKEFTFIDVESTKIEYDTTSFISELESNLIESLKKTLV